MAHHSLATVLWHLRTLVQGATAGDLTDGQLLDRFATRQDQPAFEAVMQRHAGLVWGVCLRALRNRHDAEDAFQAAFLVLARKAAALDRRGSVAGWLYTVARRIALKARAQAGRRQERERLVKNMQSPDASAEVAGQELGSVLDEELRRLPEKYRVPLLLHHVEGMTREQAARRLGWSLGTFRRRLERGREVLRARLSGRGLGLPAALLAAGLARQAEAAVPASLVAATAQAVAALTVGGTAAALVSAHAISLAEGMLHNMLMTKLKTAAVVLLAGCVVAAGAGLVARQALPAKQPEARRQDGPKATDKAADQPKTEGDRRGRTDRYGDPLPAGAVARVGTVRWWHGRDFHCPLVYTPDGKSLASCDSGKAVRFLDTTTGKELRRIQPRDDEIECFALSPDGKTMVTAGLRSRVLRIWDVATGKELRQIPVGEQGAMAVAFSPNGKLFAAVTEQSVIRLWDVPTWRETGRLTGHAGWISSVVFLRDGKTLVSGGRACRTSRWWDIGTGRDVRRLDKTLAAAYGQLALSPDGKRLAAIVSSVEKPRLPVTLYLWNATTGQEVRRTVLNNLGLSSCLCFSPDSQTLACVKPFGGGKHQTLFFAAATGRELRSWDEDSYTTQLVYSPDGKILAQAVGGVIRLRDAVTGKPARQMPILPSYVVSVEFAPGGKSLIASCLGGHTGFWDPLTGTQLAPLQGPPQDFADRPDMLLGTALTVDGTKAALVDAKEVLHVWEPATGKVWCRISEPPVGRDQADFSPDGKVVVVKHQDNIIRLWDADIGKERWALPRFRGMRFPHTHAFSADGRFLATAGSVSDPSAISLWGTATGKEVGRLTWQDLTLPSCLLFSADGKYLIAAHSGLFGRMNGRVAEVDSLRLWDLASGRELRRFPTPAGDIRSLAISPDGKTVAAAAYDTILLWELPTGQERGRFTGHSAWVWSVAFSPDGRLLASGSLDYTALVWDVTGFCPDGKLISRNLRPEEIERLWADLAGSDGVRAYRAIWTMVAAARQVVPFLAERLRPVAPVEDQQLDRLIAELDTKEFQVRSRASRELQELGDRAGPALRKALAAKPSLEVRRRLESLLHQMEGQSLSAGQLRIVRALEVLEHVGTPAARQALKLVAKGTPGARLTQEAKASLDRLAGRHTPKP